MKCYGAGLVLGLSALGAMAQVSSGETAAVVQAQTAAGEPPVAQAPVAAPTAAASLPEGVVTEQNPLKQAYLAKKKVNKRPALFRPSVNMPEVTNEEVLRDMAETGRDPILAKNIGYLPKPVLVPCAKGCEGKAYDLAVAEFTKGYWGNGRFKERGEIRMQVRWFSVRIPFSPVGSDKFGVSFIAEGKLVSIGRSVGFGNRFTGADDIARAIGGSLGRALAYTWGMGVRPYFLVPVTEGGVLDNLRGVFQASKSIRGIEDTASRFEPVTAEYEHLLPAVDGIHPGEIEPATSMHYLDGVLL